MKGAIRIEEEKNDWLNSFRAFVMQMVNDQG